jgi:hypothetical protein
MPNFLDGLNPLSYSNLKGDSYLAAKATADFEVSRSIPSIAQKPVWALGDGGSVHTSKQPLNNTNTPLDRTDEISLRTVLIATLTCDT